MATAIPQPLKICSVESPQDPGFQPLIAIYKESHPASERKPASELASMVLRPDYLFQAVYLDGVVVGFAIVVCLGQSDARLLEYMAVTERLRDRGIGQFLFNSVMGLPRVAGHFLLAEVDSERDPSADQADRLRRKRFYRRLGCREIESLNYIMPPVSTGAPPAMNIMVCRNRLPQEIPRELLRSWLRDIYVTVYDQREDDPRISTMLKDLPETAKLI